MTVQPIRLFGDPVLRTPADAGRRTSTPSCASWCKDLTDTMLDAPGAGLAAPQIGVSLRVFTYHVDDELGHLVNPDLDLSEEKQDGEEGCLSLPGLVFDCQAGAARGGQGLQHVRRAGHHRGHRAARPLRSSTRPTTSTASCSSTGSTRETRKAAMKAIREAEWFGGRRPPSRSARTRRGRREPLRRVMRARLRRHPGGRRAVPATPAADSGHEVVAVVTRPDAPAGRGRRLAASPVAELRRGARRARSSSRPPARPGLPGRLQALAPDCCPVVAYGALLPQSALDIPGPRLGQPALLAAAGLARCRSGAARAAGRRRGHRRDDVPHRARSSTPGRCTASSPSAIRPDRHRRRPARAARRGGCPAPGRHPRRDRGRHARGAAAAGGRGHRWRPR